MCRPTARRHRPRKWRSGVPPAGADPGRIRWRYSGAANPLVAIAEDNTLQVHLGGSAPFTLTEQAPVAWQEIGGRRVPVQATYALAPGGNLDDECARAALDKIKDRMK